MELFKCPVSRVFWSGGYGMDLGIVRYWIRNQTGGFYGDGWYAVMVGSFVRVRARLNYSQCAN